MVIVNGSSPRQKKRNPIHIPGLAIIFGGFLLVWLVVACSGKEPFFQPATPTAYLSPSEAPNQLSIAEMREEQPSWIFLDDSFVNSTQVESGAEIYRLVCSACHGDVGQGLTADWLEKWDPEDRNCWQSKCHGEIHPPDGFELPRYSPPVKSPIMSTMFDTAFDLYSYLKRTMPWHAPGTMKDEEYWQVTAFLIELNDIDLNGTILSVDNATEFRLRKE